MHRSFIWHISPDDSSDGAFGMSKSGALQGCDTGYGIILPRVRKEKAELARVNRPHDRKESKAVGCPLPTAFDGRLCAVLIPWQGILIWRQYQGGGDTSKTIPFAAKERKYAELGRVNKPIFIEEIWGKEGEAAAQWSGLEYPARSNMILSNNFLVNNCFCNLFLFFKATFFIYYYFCILHSPVLFCKL